MPALVLSTMPSGSTRLTVASLYSLPLINLKSSARATDAEHKITEVKIFVFTAKNRAQDRSMTMCLPRNSWRVTKCYQDKTKCSYSTRAVSNLVLARALGVWQKPCNESEEFLRGTEAPQRLQSRGRLHRRCLGARPGNRAGLSCVRRSELDHSADRCLNYHRVSHRADLRVGVRDYS